MIVLFRIQAWNFPHLLRLVSWWFLDIEPRRQISSAHAQGKIHFSHRNFGLTWLHRPVFAFNMVKRRVTINLDVLKDIHKYVLKYFPYLRMRKLTDTSCYLTQWCQNGRNYWINGIHISFDCEINGFLHNQILLCMHSRLRTTVLEQCSHCGPVAVD